MSATAKKQKPLKRHPSKLKRMSAYMILAIILISIMAVLFAFPLYWIITGSFKTGAAINSTTPEWWPSEWVLTNYQKLFAGKSAPLWQLAVPFGSRFSADGEPVYFSVGPTVPAAIRWMVNTVFMAVVSMILTCATAAMAGYALAKKRFVGRKLLFTLIVCAMALPKQVILIPLLREMSSLNLYNTIWAVIFPIVGWPFGVFLMKQFSEGIPTEMLEAARIDGASEAKTFISIVLPMVKPVPRWPLCPSSSSSSSSRSTLPRASQWVPLRAKVATTASGRNREQLLAPRSAGCKAHSRAEADAGHRKRALKPLTK